MRVSRCPFASWNPIRGYPGLSFVQGVPMRGVLHSTEVIGFYRPRSDGSYFGGAAPPHFTVDANTIWQHIDTSLGAYALENRAGGVETNREGAIQIEVMGRAAEAPTWTEATYTNLARLMRWVEADCGIDAEYIDEGHYYPPENGIRLGQEPWRISFADWPSVNCWVGHQHCPENSHGDPGKVRLDLLFPAKTGDFEEDAMAKVLLNTGPAGPWATAAPRWNPGFGRPPVFIAATPNGLVPLECPIGAHVEGNEVVLDVIMVDREGHVLAPFDVHVVAI